MRYYKIVPIGIVTEELISKCIQTSIDTVRKNLAGTHAVLKYTGQCPLEIIDYPEYTNEQASEIIKDTSNGWEEEVDL